VSNIKRAVNDRTAKDMLGEGFRRQLLMDGQYGQVLFIATQSDVLVPTELADNLRLPHSTPVAQLAAARNAFTRTRIQDDFIEGLAEMAQAAGERADRAELRRRYCLPVFTVSAIDYQKLTGVRASDGEAKVWSSLEPTEMPALQRFVREATLRRRTLIVTRHAEALCVFARGMESFLSDDGTEDGGLRASCKAAFDAGLGELRAALRIPQKAFASSLQEAVAGEVGKKLRAGAGEAAKGCSDTARGWYSKAPAPQGSTGTRNLCWSTYKACTRRDGAWKIDMNAELAEPVFRAVSTQWEKAFVSELKKKLDGVSEAATAELRRFHDSYADKLKALGVPPERAAALRGSQEAAAAAVVSSAVDKARAMASEKQKEASRQITPLVQASMRPAYQAGMLEAGAGSALRRSGLIEAHVDQTRDKMFINAIEPVAASLDALRAELSKLLSSAIDPLADAAALHYGPLWDAPNREQKEARAQLRGPFTSAALEVYGARSKLAAAIGDAPVAGAGGGEDDDEIMDVTAAETARREAQAARERVDLTLDDDDDDLPVAGPSGYVPPPRPVKKET